MWGTIISGLISAAMTYYGTSQQQNQANQQNATAGLQYNQEQAEKKSEFDQKQALSQQQQNTTTSEWNKTFANTKQQQATQNMDKLRTDMEQRVNTDQNLKNNLINIWARRA